MASVVNAAFPPKLSILFTAGEHRNLLSTAKVIYIFAFVTNVLDFLPTEILLDESASPFRSGLPDL
jgi:hypothetical protein